MAQNGNGNANANANLLNNQKNQIIDLVRDQPMIYDKAHKDHFSSNLRNQIWEDIGGQVGLPGKFSYCITHFILYFI